MTTNLSLTSRQISSLSADDLDKRITVAQQTQNLPMLHVLIEERLQRNEVISGATRRLMLLKQAIDLNIIRENETWRLGDFDTFYEYLARRRQEYESRGYDAESDLLVVRGYPTIEAWCNIIRHYHMRHALKLEVLAGIPKSKLEIASGTCNVWDAEHEGQIDPDLLNLLVDDAVASEDMLSLYANRKKAEGIEPQIEDGEPITTDDPPAGEDKEETAHQTAPELDEKDYDPRNDQELGVSLDTETGFLVAWVRRKGTEIPTNIGRLDVKDDGKRDLILSLCKSWRITLK